MWWILSILVSTASQCEMGRKFPGHLVCHCNVPNQTTYFSLTTLAWKRTVMEKKYPDVARGLLGIHMVFCLLKLHIGNCSLCFLKWVGSVSIPGCLISARPTHSKYETIRWVSFLLKLSLYFSLIYCTWSNRAIEQLWQDLIRTVGYFFHSLNGSQSIGFTLTKFTKCYKLIFTTTAKKSGPRKSILRCNTKKADSRCHGDRTCTVRYNTGVFKKRLQQSIALQAHMEVLTTQVRTHV